MTSIRIGEIYMTRFEIASSRTRNDTIKELPRLVQLHLPQYVGHPLNTQMHH